jgi:ribonuclease-3
LLLRLRELGVPIGPTFAQPAQLAEALTHASFASERGERLFNERLEFLGDSVVNFMVAELLFDWFPSAPEGELTRLRASLVDAASFAAHARRLGLGPLLALGRGEELSGGRDRQNVLADAFEALMAALYRTEGLAVVRALLEALVRDDAMAAARDGGAPRDFKSRFQALAQGRFDQTPTYQIVSEEGPDHARVFHAQVRVGAVVVGSGFGISKKQAQQAAAQVACEHWDAVEARLEAARTASAQEPS